MIHSGATWAPRVLSIVRVAAALIFLLHGTQKLFGFPATPPTGLPAAFTLFWFGAIIELVGGLLLLVGLVTRPVALILSGEMAVAYWMFHAPRNLYPTLNGGDAAILFCFLFLYLAFAGPGPWSADAALKRDGKLPAWA